MRFNWLLISAIALGLVTSTAGSYTWADVASAPVEAGFRTLSFGQPNGSCNTTPTGEKPQSKLWFNDGFWWASLCNDFSEDYRIYWLDLVSQSWLDTGVVLDERTGSKADLFWDDQPLWHPWIWRGTSLEMADLSQPESIVALQALGLISKTPRKPHLYAVSHVFTKKGQSSSSPSHWGRLYRYSYDPQNKTYGLDWGFPISITRGKSETLTIAKDTTAQLWVTYVEDNKVMLNRSLGNDLVWDEPFPLSDPNAMDLQDDDIAAVVAFAGRIGVMWSNQNQKTMYFGIHQDGTPPQQWSVGRIFSDNHSASDDHIDLKVDHSGNLYSVIKTSLKSPQDPLIVLMTCSAKTECTETDNWQKYTVYQVQDNHSRPTLLIDGENRQLHIFTVNSGVGGEIQRKVTDLDNIRFSPGPGEPFIQSSGDGNINNVTSTKQTLDSTTGLAVLSSDHYSKYYFHNHVALPNSNSPLIFDFMPRRGIEGIEVILSGQGFEAVTDVIFNGVKAEVFTVVSNTELRATVPTGAGAGKIGVINAYGYGVSVANFFQLSASEATTSPSTNLSTEPDPSLSE